MPEFVNFYELLGISPDATPEEIKRAYRRLALKYHPDTSEKEEIDKFLAISEAFRTLIDAERRREYDRQLALHQKKRAQFTPYFTEISDPFWQNLARYDAIRHAEQVRSRGERRLAIRNRVLEVLLHPMEARRSHTLVVEIPVQEICHYCAGTGIEKGFICTFCQGEGEILSEQMIPIQVPVLDEWRKKYRLNLRPFGINDDLEIEFKLQYFA